LKFREKLVPAIFLERISRFTVLVDLDGKRELAHLHDPGRLDTVLEPRLEVFLRNALRNKRKTQYDIVLARRSGVYVLIHTGFANPVFAEGVKGGVFEELSDYGIEKAEIRYGKSRIDFLLRNAIGERMLVEVKSVTKAVGSTALFPDAPTSRGRKHLIELMESIGDGFRAGVVFIVFRQGIERFAPDDEIDAKFSTLLKEAQSRGVKVIAVATKIDLNEVRIMKRIPIELG